MSKEILMVVEAVSTKKALRKKSFSGDRNGAGDGDQEKVDETEEDSDVRVAIDRKVG